MLTKCKNSMLKEFDMSDFRSMCFFLGIKVLQSKNGIFICQWKYVNRIIIGLISNSNESIIILINSFVSDAYAFSNSIIVNTEFVHFNVVSSTLVSFALTFGPMHDERELEGSLLERVRPSLKKELLLIGWAYVLA